MIEKINKIDKNFYCDLIVKNLLQKELEVGNPIPNISMDEISVIREKNKNFYSLSRSSPHYKIQKRLEKFLFKNITLNASCFSFRKGYSFLNYLEPHICNTRYCHLDIVSFFHSIDINLVKNVFSVYFSDEFLVKDKQTLLESFIASISLSTKTINNERTFIPMGFTSSPSISNIIFRKFDILIQKLCNKYNITYTRYADDLLFSSKDDTNILKSTFFLNEISSILSMGNFKLNNGKYLLKDNLISLGGYVIENSSKNGERGKIRLSQNKLKKINKLIYELNHGRSPKYICNKLFNLKIKNFLFKKNIEKFENKFYTSQVKNKLTGYRSYLIYFILFNEKYGCIDNNYLDKSHFLIKKIEKKLKNYT